MIKIAIKRFLHKILNKYIHIEVYLLTLYKCFLYEINLSKTLIITGADYTHYDTLVQLLDNLSLCFFNKSKRPTLLVWDLGLKPVQIRQLQKKFANWCEFKTFEYSNYPEWFNIKENAGEYAWKPNIIKESMLFNKKKYVFWFDSGNLIVNEKKFSELYEFLNKYKIYSPVSSGVISQWTHVGMLRYLGLTDVAKDIYGLRNRSGGLVGFKVSDTRIRSFITEFARLASVRECIAPVGSSRLNHRQDQSLLSIMYYQFIHREFKIGYEYFQTNPLISGDELLGVSIHNDIEAARE